MFAKKHKKASILIVSLVLILIMSISALGLYKFVQTMNRFEELKNDNLVAFYAAEAGVNKVIHFFNHPEDYSADLNLFYYDEPNDEYPNLKARLASGDVVLTPAVFPSFDFKNLNDGKLSKVVELIILRPTAADPSGCFAKIKSVGSTYNSPLNRDVQKTIYLYIFKGGLAVKSPAGIISYATSMFNGDVVVNWGEVWSRGPCNLPNPSKWNNLVDYNDPGWTAIRTDEYFIMQGADYMDGTRTGSPTPLTLAAGDRYYNPCLYPCQLSRYDGRFLQHQTLNFPEFKYEEYKEIALRRGEYYSTDAAGNIYRDGIKDDAHKIISFYEEFGKTDPNSSQMRFVFIDTTDGLPPRADSSNLTTIKLSGSSPYVKGCYYICANFDTSGMGNPPTITVQNPANQDVNLQKLFMNGLIYVAGYMDVTGNPVIYGSLVVRNSITGTGTPNVYYNYRLASGLYFPINSRVNVRLYKVL